MKKVFPFLFLVLNLVFSQSFKKVGTTGYVFLEVPVSPRASGVGDAGVALFHTSADAIFINPALTGFMTKKQSVNFTLANWLADVKQIASAYTVKLGNIGVLGISFVRFDFGTMQGTVNANPDQPGNYIITETFSADAFALGVSYAKMLTDKFSFGGLVKYVREKIWFYKSDNFVFDVGILYFTGFRSLRIAGAVQNFGVDSKYIGDSFKMPIMFKIGMAGEIIGEYDQPTRLSLMIEALHPSDSPEKLNLGIEYTYKNFLSFRGGYKLNYDEENFTFGFGINGSSAKIPVNFDFSYLNFNRLGSVIRVGIGMDF
ncbi:hypothetical protein JGI2_00608 [Candidatus Kryptobacter tengchongensis]|nr:hypothetical protein JGI2_00608 [Candidatus Kryptobacter tengchongensis]